MCDLAAVADDVGIEYRLVGGQMVRLHVALADVPEPVVRVTQDADMGIEATSARDPALVPGLEALGYTRPGASNRFIRTTDDDLRLVIDVLAPAWGRRLVPNQQHGDIVLDEIPGLSLALARPGEQIDLTVTMLDGTAMSFPAVIPEINSALCLRRSAGRAGWPRRTPSMSGECCARTGSGFRNPSSGATPAFRATPPTSSAPTSSDRQVAASAQRRRIVPNRPRSEPWRLPCCAPDAWLDQRESNSHRQHS
jgi:hypothetical protein